MVSQLETPTLSTSRQLPYSVEGLVQVFTASQRSFFTNVMAQALRIAGQGTPVLVVQFLKGGIHQGVDHPTQLGQNLDWFRGNMPCCINSSEIEDDVAIALRELWEHTQQVVLQRKYSLVVLDELSLAINLGLISEAEVLAFIAKRPRDVDMILTGPDMPQSILDIADQITELRRTYRA